MLACGPGTIDALSSAEQAALALDEAAVRLARSRGVIELAVGRTLALLFRGEGLLRLGYSRESDYARERLGVSASTMYAWVRLARALALRPLLERAVLAGAVSPRKALTVLPLAFGAGEAAWTDAAMRLTLREIEAAVRSAGLESPDERFEAEAITLPMTPAQQDRFDAALALARETIGPEARRWQCLEAICSEWLGAFAGWRGKGPRAEGDPPAAAADGLEEALARRLAAIDESLAVVREIDGAPGADDPLSLDARILRLLAARRGFDGAFGALLERVQRERAFRTLGYRSFAEYCRERLGICERTARERIWLERRMRALPALRRSVATGRLTYSKALLVARVATPCDVEERIAEAASTTWQQTERETTAAVDRRNRAAGIRQLWGPKEAARTFWDAIASAQAWSEEVRGERIGAGEALAVIADHFVDAWSAHLPRLRELRIPGLARRGILTRKGGLCAVPGCSRAAQHVHHIVYRSRGGSDEAENQIGLCAPHHLHGIHLGYLEVAGRAGERLYWRFGAAELVPVEEWLTLGDDDVRRADGRVRVAPGAVVREGDVAGADGTCVVACVLPRTRGRSRRRRVPSESTGNRAWRRIFWDACRSASWSTRAGSSWATLSATPRAASFGSTFRPATRRPGSAIRCSGASSASPGRARWPSPGTAGRPASPSGSTG